MRVMKLAAIALQAFQQFSGQAVIYRPSRSCSAVPYLARVQIDRAEKVRGEMNLLVD
jgi:hypothetical protein